MLQVCADMLLLGLADVWSITVACFALTSFVVVNVRTVVVARPELCDGAARIGNCFVATVKYLCGLKILAEIMETDMK